MKKLLQSLFILLFIAGAAMAQDRTIIGAVTDQEDGKPLPGVTVRITGTKLGTQTGADGKFSISVPASATTIEFSYLGYATQSQPLTSNIMRISMALDSKALSEVVVTALGVERTARSTGYSSQQLSNKELTQARVLDISTGLQSKVSGLQVNLTGNGVNSETRVVLRGNRSIRGNNEALIVLDGVPVPNSVLTSLNPNDVESINVLKGANAAALYGTDGVNGVLIIQTKKGKSGAATVTFSNTTTFESVQFMPDFQYEFGAGYDLNTYVPYENTSWGPKFDGSIKNVGPELVDGSQYTLPFSPLKDEKMKFWDTGVTLQNDVAISGGDEKSTYYFSFQDANIKGVVPEDRNRRTGARFNASRKFNKLTTSFNLGYTTTKTDITKSSPYDNLINIPQNIPITQLSDWRNNPFAAPDGYFSGYFPNPYWEIDNNRRNTRKEVFSGNVELKYDFTDWLKATYRVGLYNDNSNYKEYYAQVDYTDAYDRPTDDKGSVTDRSDNLRRINADLLLEAKHSFGDFNTGLILGNNIKDNYTKFVSETANALVIPGLYNVSNRTGEATVSSDFTNSRQVAVFGQLDVDYKKIVYLSVTGRQEWVSLLSEKNRSYFYPGASLSFIFTDAIPGLKESKFLTSGKILASANRTANVSLTPYQLETTFEVGRGFPYASLPGFSMGNVFANPDLEPEFINSFEIGTQLNFWNGRMNLDATYFSSNVSGTIVPIATSSSTGYSSAYVNAGEVSNKGVELGLRGTAIQSGDWRLDLGMNYTYLDNKVVSLYQGLDEIPLGGFANSAYIYAVRDQQYPVIKATAYLRDPEGHIVVDPTTGYARKTVNMKNLGQTNPKHRVGFDMAVTYKNLRLAGQFDYRTGNVFYSNVGNNLDFTGLSAHSAAYGRLPFVIPNSVVETSPGVYAPNTKTNDGGFDYWYGQYRNIQENYIKDATFLKLRELSLTYNFSPAFLAKQKVIKAASIGLVGRNLFTWLPKENVFTDPEFNFTTGNSIGISDLTSTPPTRIYGFNVNLTF